MSRPIIVFSDLDGTLLDHDDYSYAAAAPTLDELRAANIPLILCSSKTATEISPLRAALGFSDCAAIVENGAGVLPACATRPTPASTHRFLLSLLDRLPAQLREPFSGFSSWSSATLQTHTGLDAKAARAAAQRDYSEPGLWLGDPTAKAKFVDALHQQGVTAQQGGRFLTLGFASSKAPHMQQIIENLEQELADTVTSIALGDAPNDIDMLEQADRGIIIPNPAHAGLPTLAGESTGRIIRARRAGPAGWNASLQELLQALK